MDYLFIINTVLIGLFHVMWKREDWFNMMIKVILFTVFVLNVIRLTTGKV
jgi:hypothetical protein